MQYDPDEALKLKNQICFPLYAAARRITGAYTPYLKPLGLTYTQYIAFMVLWEQDGLSVSEICSRLCLDSGTVTPLLKKMETAGWVRRRRSAEDERSVQIFLTEEGRAMKQKVSDVPRQVGSCFCLNAEDAQKLYVLLYQILAPECKAE
ncbi:MAG: MarR family transcriptional regulator [Firmicutes bacterium]|nr:MarR family transcriptional regulator [Bacillota bacterium]